MARTIEITNISWIDMKNLPPVKIGMMWEALKGGEKGWDDRAVIGLIATSNPPAPASFDKVEAFQKRQQYRALTSFKLTQSLDSFVGKPIIDPGWTPPFDSNKLPWLAGLKPIPEEATKFHPGEASAISSASLGKKLNMSAIELPQGAQVIANIFIKFRAGEATNNLGLEEAQSPYHVPWVWSETMLIQHQGKLKLFGKSSAFPSHAWYVNGKQVMTVLQSPISAKSDEPALSTGRPVSQPRVHQDLDRSEGTIMSHLYTVPAGKQVSALVKVEV